MVMQHTDPDSNQGHINEKELFVWTKEKSKQHLHENAYITHIWYCTKSRGFFFHTVYWGLFMTLLPTATVCEIILFSKNIDLWSICGSFNQINPYPKFINLLSAFSYVHCYCLHNSMSWHNFPINHHYHSYNNTHLVPPPSRVRMRMPRPLTGMVYPSNAKASRASSASSLSWDWAMPSSSGTALHCKHFTHFTDFHQMFYSVKITFCAPSFGFSLF